MYLANGDGIQKYRSNRYISLLGGHTNVNDDSGQLLKGCLGKL